MEGADNHGAGEQGTEWDSIYIRAIDHDSTWVLHTKDNRDNGNEDDKWTWRIDLWLPRGGGGSGVDWELGVNRCTLLPLECISNRSCCVALGTMSSHL